MPRRTPVKELQQEEPIPGSPLRRSSRLTNTNSSTPVPTRVLTRRNSSETMTAVSTPTPKVTRSRRSSLSQENQNDEPEKKKPSSTVRTRRNSLQPDEPEAETLTPRPRTRASSVTKEVEVKKTPRRRRSITDDSESDEPTRKSTRSRSTSLTKKEEGSPTLKKVATPAKKGVSTEQANGLDLIEENSNESSSPEKEKSAKLKKRNTELDLSVIKEASFTEDEKSPKKQTEDEPTVNGHVESESKSAESSSKVAKNTESDSKKLFDSSASDSSFKLQLSTILDVSTKESDADTNKENVHPNDEVEPMEVDQTVLNASSKSLNTSAKNVSEDTAAKKTEEASSLLEKEMDKEVELAFEHEKKGTEAEIEELATPVAEDNGLESSFEEYAAEDNQSETEALTDSTQKNIELEQQSIAPKENVPDTQIESHDDENAFHDEIQSDVESLKVDDDKEVEDTPRADTSEEKPKENKNAETVSEVLNKDEDEHQDVFDSEEKGYKSPVKQPRPHNNENENSTKSNEINIDSKYYAMVSPKEKQIQIVDEEDDSDSDSNVVIELSEEESAKETEKGTEVSSQELPEDSETEKAHNVSLNTSKNISLNDSNKVVLNSSKNASLNSSKNASLNSSKNASLDTSKKRSFELWASTEDDKETKEKSVNTSIIQLSEESEVEKPLNVSLNTSFGNSKNVSQNSFKNLSLNASKRLSLDSKSITMQEVVKAGDDLEKSLGERINKAVGLLCAGIKNDADISFNVSLEYTGQPNEAEDDKTAKIEVALTAEPIVAKGSKRRKIEIVESDEESDVEEVAKAVLPQKASPEKKRRRKKSELSLSLAEPSAESSPKVCFDKSAGLESPNKKATKDSVKQPLTPFRRVSSVEEEEDEDVEEEESSDSEEENEGSQFSTNFIDLLTANFEESDIQDTTWNPTETDSDTDYDSDEVENESTIIKEESPLNASLSKDKESETATSQMRKLFRQSRFDAATALSSSSDADKEEPAKAKKVKSKKTKQGSFKSKEAVVAAQKAEVPERKRKTSRIMDDEVSSSKMKKVTGQKKEDKVVFRLKPSVGKTRNVKPLKIKPSTGSCDGWEVSPMV